MNQVIDNPSEGRGAAGEQGSRTERGETLIILLNSLSWQLSPAWLRQHRETLLLLAWGLEKITFHFLKKPPHFFSTYTYWQTSVQFVSFISYFYLLKELNGVFNSLFFCKIKSKQFFSCGKFGLRTPGRQRNSTFSRCETTVYPPSNE